MTAMEKIEKCGVVPVVVLDRAEDAVPTAKAMLRGGVNVMEITFRTAAAPDAIRAVAQACPDMLVGAGTVITLEQCRRAVECGAKFIVSPGFDEEVVRWCTAHDVAVCPGCVTPTEVMAALRCGLSGMKALSAPFGGVRFIPTGGVSAANLKEYAAAPFVCAVGGSWLCPKKEIAAGNFEKVEQLCREAHSILDA